MGKISQENGRKFEERLCDYFSRKGFYVIYNEKGITRFSTSRHYNNKKQYCNSN